LSEQSNDQHDDDPPDGIDKPASPLEHATESPVASEAVPDLPKANVEPAAHEHAVTESPAAAEAVAAVAEAPSAAPEATEEAPAAPEAPRKGRRGKRTDVPAHASPQTDAPDVEAAASAAMDAAEASERNAPADGEGAEGETPAAGEGHEPPERLKSIIESLVFAADKPLSIRKLQELTGEKNAQWIQSCIEFLRADYADRGVVLHEVAGGYQFRTNPLNAHWVQQLIAGKPVKLSRAQLETLAIVAYRQPITRPEIDEIRGVDSGGTLKVLLDRSLVRILGKKEEPGRPMLYGTTKDFLEFFNLRDLKEMPTLREFYELNEDSMAKIRELDERRAAEGSPAVGQPAPEASETVADETAAAPSAPASDSDEADAPAQ
jgi:segregation and condensation protein B